MELNNYLWYRNIYKRNGKFHKAFDMVDDKQPFPKVQTYCGLKISVVSIVEEPSSSKHDFCKSCKKYGTLTLKPKTVYSAGVNLSGLWGPFQMSLDTELDTWLDKTGNFEAERKGLVEKHGNIIFTSSSKNDVLIWVSGVRSAMSLLKQWSHNVNS